MTAARPQLEQVIRGTLLAHEQRTGKLISQLYDEITSGMVGENTAASVMFTYGEKDPNVFEQALHWFNNPEVSAWNKLAVGIGIPLALHGLANATFGDCGMGSLMLGAIGSGAAAVGSGVLDPYIGQ